MPRIVDHDARRREILGQCLHLFAARGYNGLSMRQLARQLGVSTGTLYHYFPSKDGLFAAMFRQLASDAIRTTTGAAPPGASQADRLEILARYVEDNADTLIQALRIAQDVHRHQTGEGDRAVLQETLAAFATAIADQLELPDPALGRVLLSHLIGTLAHRELDPDQVDIGQHLRLAMILGGHLGAASG